MPDAEHDRRHRAAAAEHPARWTVEGGALVGRQAGEGFGGFLVTDEVYDDFVLTLDVRPDWPADTGVYLRANARCTRAYQVLIDHRPSGALGGFYGNGIGGFHAVGFTIDASEDDAGHPTGLRVEDPRDSWEPATAAKASLLSYACPPEQLLAAWSWGDWNTLRIQCVGRHPRITVWLNGLLATQIDTSMLPEEAYDADGVEALLDPAGHIALEVHDSDLYVASTVGPSAVTRLGDRRWGKGSAVRWRNLTIAAADAAADDIPAFEPPQPWSSS